VGASRQKNKNPNESGPDAAGGHDPSFPTMSFRLSGRGRDLT
jgi:hypothetical protein